jgi:hypothetical protein
MESSSAIIIIRSPRKKGGFTPFFRREKSATLTGWLASFTGSKTVYLSAKIDKHCKVFHAYSLDASMILFRAQLKGFGQQGVK